ncbi:MAG: alanine--tRNA ligase [bacterium]
MKSSDIRSKYLAFFKKRGHAIIPAASIMPLEDTTTLFTGSGMQQMVPYLKGATHPKGTRLTDSQPSFRTDDIEEVGDNRHTCMFEMLGNWSLGDYFKKEQLPWFYEFMTEEVGLDPTRLYVTVFAGDSGIPEDEDAIKIWQDIFGNTTTARDGKLGFDPNIKIYTYSSNWWSRAGGPTKMPVGEIGGPDSEMFYDFGEDHKFHENSTWKDDLCHLNCDCGRFLEIGNSVFMQFEKQEDDSFKPLPAQNVDFGGGFERIVAASNNDPDIFKIDMFAPIIRIIEVTSGKKYEGDNLAPMRVIADHLRAATFMMGEGLEPSNKMQGYVLRRLLRRAAVKARHLGVDAALVIKQSIPGILEEYVSAGFLKAGQTDRIIEVATTELTKFGKALDKGLRELEKCDAKDLNARFAFDLFQSSGFPFEITEELAKQKGVTLSKSDFDAVFQTHRNDSRTASVGMFRGGLADQSEVTTKLHTATHLLQSSMRKILGNEISQAGSNITPERLRFDYTFSGKPTPDQLIEIENMINDTIKKNLPITRQIENKIQAIKSGAMAFFADKYPDEVSVYIVGNVEKDWFSKELCGGPHVNATGEIGGIKIFKEESLGSGKRRIYAKLVTL